MPLEDIDEETKRILGLAEERNVTLRLLGGMAVRFHCPSALIEPLARKCRDIDFFGFSKQSKDIQTLFADLGYHPRDRFNALSGEWRLIFNDLEHERRVDIFLDVFEMCHKFDFKKRVQIETSTLPLADLVVTKLQVVQMTEREYKDLMCLLLDHSIGAEDRPEIINCAYIAKLASDDWGIYMTFKQTIRSLIDGLEHFALTGEQQKIVRDRAQQMLTMIEQEPKSVRWKVRARIGERVTWYELPEPDKEIVN
jgi:hypothetical protein